MLRRAAVWVGIVVVVVSLGACKRQQPPSADALATVNGKEIKRDELEKHYRTRVNPEGPQPSHEEELSLKLSILDELINNQILSEQSQKLGIEASDGEVEDKFTEFKSPYTEDEFQRQLKERGLSVEDLKKDLKRQISIQKLLNREVLAKVSITDQDITDFYNQNRAQFNIVEPQVRILQLMVTPRKDTQVRNRKNDDATTDAEARRKILGLLERLNNGADFATLAMDFSEDPTTAVNGGDLGFIPESALNQSDPGLKKAVLGLRVGEISKIIDAPDGYRILRLISREPAGQRQLNDPQVQATIRDTLKNRKEQLLRAAYMVVMREQAKVDNFLARQVYESTGKLPETTGKAGSGTSGSAAPATPPAKK